MIGFDPVVRKLLGHMHRVRPEFFHHAQVRAGLVGGDLHWRWAVGERAGEEEAGRRGVALLGQQHVDDLPVLVDRPVQIPPPAATFT
jgi:hypothetical protein